MLKLSTGDLNRLITIERPVRSTSPRSAGSGAWEFFDEVWANVQDTLPSRAERLSDGMPSSTLTARVRMRYRDDITSKMRFVVDGRQMEIISGPAEIGRREGVEFMVEQTSPGGNSN